MFNLKTEHKKYGLMAGMLLLGLYGLGFGLPEIFTKALFGTISLVKVAAGITLFGIYLLFDHQVA